MEKWYIKNKKADFAAIASALGISEELAQLLVNRNLRSREQMWGYLHPQLEGMHSPFAMKDMEKACVILREKIEGKKKIRIIGDYDVDGVMSVYILLKALKQFGARVDYAIPDRILDGYGINEKIIAAAGRDGIDTILTCDNGIAAIEPVKYAAKLGMTVVITDHHDVFYEEQDNERHYRLPEADAVVNPRQEDCSYPYPHICGAFIAYKLAKAYDEKYEVGLDAEKHLMEFAAIATICDVMDLTDENRILVKHGLKALGETGNFGLQALMEVTKVDPKRLGVYSVGFVLGPCINASGRLKTAEDVLMLLEAGSREEALPLAGQLRELNEERKKMTDEGVEEALRLIEGSALKEDAVLVVYLPRCHESLAGIIAGRLRERFYRPAFVLTRGESGVKGSGRSIEGYSMYEKLCQCSELLEHFGGHPMAAGFTLLEENIGKLRDGLNRQAELSEEDLMPKVTFDFVLPLDRVTDALLEDFSLLEPFGKGNSRPLFAVKNVIAASAAAMGGKGRVLRLMLKTPEDNKLYQAVLFQRKEAFDGYMTEKHGKKALEELYQGKGEGISMDLVYRAQWNEYRGETTRQLVVEYYR